MLSAWIRPVVAMFLCYGLGYLHGSGTLQVILRVLCYQRNAKPKTNKLQTRSVQRASTTFNDEAGAPALPPTVDEPLPSEAAFILKNAMRMMEIFVPWIIYRFGPLLDGVENNSPRPRQLPEQCGDKRSSVPLSITDETAASVVDPQVYTTPAAAPA